MINNIKKTYGKDITIFIGDWSEGKTQMKNYESTPRIGIKRKLLKHFKVYNIDEYNTSKKNCYTEKTNNNLKIKIPIKCKKDKEKIKKSKNILKESKNILEESKNILKESKNILEESKNILEQICKNKLFKLHSVLTYKMKNKRIGCINRDVNSCKNMLKIIKSWFDKKERPKYLKRD